jgi:ketosteroid isomerase-like protein
MYHQMVKRIIHKGFADISRADYEPLLKQFAPNVHFTFAGEHALAADFHSRETVRQWFHRLHRIFPGFRIEPRRIILNGFPWNTVAAVQFVVEAPLPDGTRYQNYGVQIVRIVWGRVVEDHLVEDSQLLADTLRSLDVSEAHAARLRDQETVGFPNDSVGQPVREQA